MAPLPQHAITLAETGDLDGLRDALRAQPDLARGTGPGDETLLHISVRQWPKHVNGADIARLLLDHGTDINARDDSGQTPIQGATGDLELTRVLLDAGADPAVYSIPHLHMCPAEVCLFYGLPEEARLLVARGGPLDLRIAAGIGDLDHVRSCLTPDGAFRADSICPPDRPGPTLSVSDGVTQALSFAARNGALAVIEFLLDHGADIDALVPHFDVGCTPLHQAVSGNHRAVAELLIRRGARLDLRDDTHHATPREWAEHQEQSELRELLLRAESTGARAQAALSSPSAQRSAHPTLGSYRISERRTTFENRQVNGSASGSIRACRYRSVISALALTGSG